VNQRPPTNSVHQSILTEHPLSIHIWYMCVLPYRRRNALETTCQLRTLASLLSTLVPYARVTATQSDPSWQKSYLRCGQRLGSTHTPRGTQNSGNVRLQTLDDRYVTAQVKDTQNDGLLHDRSACSCLRDFAYSYCGGK
jgi:hypothetical protein